MRIYIHFESETPIVVPTGYNHGVQGMIYRLMSDKLRRVLHDGGFGYGSRKFKMFTFSRILGRFRRVSKKFVFERHVRLCISSPIDKIIREISNSLLKKGEVHLYGNVLKVTQIEIPDRPVFGESVNVRTLSPVTVYSTLMKADGTKKTYYYSPFEPEFSELVTENLRKKASILRGKPIKGKVEIEPLRRGSCREVICIFKGTVIKAWEGYFRVRGDPVLLETMYEAGLGSKNSAGFGLVEVV